MAKNGKHSSFDIGQWVHFDGICEMRKGYGRRDMEHVQASGFGVISGMRVCFSGAVDYNLPEDGGVQFTAKQRHLFYEVRTSMLGKPLLVLPEHVRPMRDYESPSPALPLYPDTSSLWSPRDRANLREEMKSWPRDACGRFLKKVRPAPTPHSSLSMGAIMDLVEPHEQDMDPHALGFGD